MIRLAKKISVFVQFFACIGCSGRYTELILDQPTDSPIEKPKDSLDTFAELGGIIYSFDCKLSDDEKVWKEILARLNRKPFHELETLLLNGNKLKRAYAFNAMCIMHYDSITEKHRLIFNDTINLPSYKRGEIEDFLTVGIFANEQYSRYGDWRKENTE